MKKLFYIILLFLFGSSQIIGQSLSDFSGVSDGDSFCLNESNVTITAINNSSGTFSGSGITDLANGSATFNPSTAGAGNHDISYEVLSGFQKISSGVHYSLAIKDDGSLWAWGYNIYGMLGDGTTTDKSVPVQIGTDTDWIEIVAVGYWSFGIKSNGTLWAWGYNTYGCLGIGNITNQLTPTQVGTDTDWVSVSGSSIRNYSMAIKSNGTLWGWGYADEGGMGTGSQYGSSNTPIQIGTDTDWSQVSIGDRHTMATKSDGTLWTWGYNAFGQLGNGGTTNLFSPTQVGTATNWDKISAGYNYSVALKMDGTLWATGHNIFGMIGTGSNLPANITSFTQIGSGTNWRSVNATEYHTLAIQNDGTLWAWGYNAFGRLGDGTTVDKYAPIQIGTSSNWSSITAGQTHSMAIDNDNKLWSWGFNSKGQLGIGSTVQKHSPTLINSTSSTTKTISVLPLSTGTDIQTACGSFQWIDGNTYTSNNNTATHTITNGAANGCDSIVTLDLTINTFTTGTDIQTACGSFQWIDGNTYTSNNNSATHTIINGAANGCDSIVTLNLTINTFTTGTDIQTACGSFQWIDGNTYTSNNNSATHTIMNGAVNGCDSIVTLNLTINSLPNVSANATQLTICEGDSTQLTGSGAVNYSWDNGLNNGDFVNPSSNTTYTVTGTDANNCSNTSQVTINVNPMPTVSISLFDNNPVCVYNTAVSLPSGSPSGGVYSGTGVSAGTFNPQTSGVGTFDITYTYTNEFNCTSSDMTQITVEGCLGFNQNDTDPFKISPNPFSSTIHVSNLKNGSHVSLLDMNGKLVLEHVSSATSLILNTEKLENGIYFLQVVSDSQITTKKVVKQ